mgnify:CR=1 FL=1
MRVLLPLFFAFLPGLLLATLAFAAEPSVEEGPPFRHGGDAGTMDSCDADPHAGTCAVKPPFKIKSESSLLDYLDPTLLEDDETLADARKSLLNGQLVAIRDAFIPGFAEYVWKQLDSDDLKWASTPDVSTVNDSAPGHISRKHLVANQRAYSTELLEALGILSHPTTKGFR